MPLITASDINPSYLTTLARRKASQECSRPEHDLRLLLAHVRILDVLEHNTAELSDHSDDEQEMHEALPGQHGPEYERTRPRHPERVSKTVEDAALEELFDTDNDTRSKVAMATLVSVEEVEIQDWDT